MARGWPGTRRTVDRPDARPQPRGPAARAGLRGPAATALALALGLGLGGLAGRTTGPDAPGPGPATGRDSPAARESRALLARLDELEAELAHARTLVALNEELARRHEHVSALACENALEQLGLTERLCASAKARSSRGRRFAAAADVAPKR